jgi:hypothetical protein
LQKKDVVVSLHAGRGQFHLKDFGAAKIALIRDEHKRVVVKIQGPAKALEGSGPERKFHVP